MEKVKIVGTGVILGIGLVYIARRLFVRRIGSRREERPSGNWREVGIITQLNVYPVKSFHGIRMDEGRATSIGIEEVPKPGRMSLGDRRMMLYNENSMEFVAARTYSHLVNVRVEAASLSEITLTYQNDSITFKLPTDTAERRIKLWTEIVPLLDCGDEVASWIQEKMFNGKTCYRLAYYANPDIRRHIPHLVEKFSPLYPFMCDEFTGACSDLSPYLLLNESSMSDLNNHIKERAQNESREGEPDDVSQVSCDNFRGNLIVRGPAAYEEDGWKWIRVGSSVIFRNFKPCTRCYLTTVNPDTGVKDPKTEPISSLNTYRMLSGEAGKLHSTPAFGIYLGLWNSPDILRVGDKVYVCD